MYNDNNDTFSLQPFEDQATCDLLQKFAKLQNEFHPQVRHIINCTLIFMTIIQLYNSLFCVQQSDEVVKEIIAKLHEHMPSDGDSLMQITPSFTQHVLSVDGFIESSKPTIIAGTQIQNLSSVIYSKVGVLFVTQCLYILYLTNLIISFL